MSLDVRGAGASTLAPSSRSRRVGFNGPWLIAVALVVVGLVGGVAFDPKPERAAVHRAGYRVLEADLHAHTTYSDGTLSPFTLVRQAERRGLDVVAVTEHNTVIPGRLARAWSKLTGGPMMLVGEEITTRQSHLVAVGIETTISPNLPITEVVEAIHAQGGVAIGAHPVERFQGGLAPVRAELDGVEVVHPIALLPARPRWNWRDMLAYYEETSPRPAAIGSSDYHFATVLGICRTLVFVREPVSEATVLEALRARRTVVFDPDGVALGPPDLLSTLAREPYQARSSDYGYRGEGWLDRICRILGLLGVAGVVFLRPHHPRTEPTSSTIPSPASND